jgi:hypothetical protein
VSRLGGAIAGGLSGQLGNSFDPELYVISRTYENYVKNYFACRHCLSGRLSTWPHRRRLKVVGLNSVRPLWLFLLNLLEWY